MKVDLCGRYGDHIMSGSDGEALGGEIAAALQRAETVAIDFSGVKSILSAFLNPAVGSLYARFPADMVDRLVTAIDATDLQRSSFDAVRESAREYHNDPRVRLARESAIQDLLVS